jgi:hypothetical protein
VGRGIVPVCAALAAAVVPGCSRTGLDDGIAFRPGSPGVPSGDAASSGDDAFPSSSGGGGSASGDDGRPSSESDGADLFSPREPDADSAGPRAIDGQGPGRAPGTAPCGAGDCTGCCAGDGTCRSGFETSACGNGGQPCMECEAERSCNDRGTCL